MSRFTVAKSEAHDLQRIIELLVDHCVVEQSDHKAQSFWRGFLKRLKNRQGSYVALENIIGKHKDGESFGLMKEMQDLPAKYSRSGWLRNRLK